MSATVVAVWAKKRFGSKVNKVTKHPILLECRWMRMLAGSDPYPTKYDLKAFNPFSRVQFVPASPMTLAASTFIRKLAWYQSQAPAQVFCNRDLLSAKQRNLKMSIIDLDLCLSSLDARRSQKKVPAWASGASKLPRRHHEDVFHHKWGKVNRIESDFFWQTNVWPNMKLCIMQKMLLHIEDEA